MNPRPLVFALALFVGADACSSVRALTTVEALQNTRAARLHLRDGSVCVLENARLVSGQVVGYGAQYDAERALVRSGRFRVPVASIDVVVVDVSAAQSVDRAMIGMAVVSGASLIGTAACLANPKACFGSCPTFYVTDHGRERVQAEAFSTSIARALTADDLDDLPDVSPHEGAVEIEMRNEAMETHLTSRVALRVVHGPPGSRPYRDFHRERYDALQLLRPASSCEGETCGLLGARDGQEVVPPSDGRDLAARTSMTLTFAPPHQAEVALALTARNSLMNTWVFYHLLGALGRDAPAYFAALDRGDREALASLDRYREAFGVDVAVRDPDGSWRAVDTLPYIGPIARATRATRFTVRDPDASVTVRLTFARAHWRLDAAQLGAVVARDLTATTVWPTVTSHNLSRVDDPAASLRDGEAPLVTLPGEHLTLRFDTPDADAATGFFLSTRGYYREWLRDEWMRHENRDEARAALTAARATLRALAPAYATEDEGRLRGLFEESRIR